MDLFLLAMISGLGAGGLFAMLGSGIVAAYKGSGVINFAHGAVAMYSAYTWSELTLEGDIKLPWFDPIPDWGFLETLGINNFPVTISVRDEGFNTIDGFWGTFWPIALGLGMSVLIGLMMHYLVFRPLRNAPALAKVIGSVGAMLYLQSAAQLNFGSTLRTQDGFLPKGSWENALGFGGDIGWDRIIVAGAAVVMGLVVTAIYRYTRFGLATRAADENEKGAALLGYSAQKLARANWVLSALMAGIAGILYVGIGTLNPVNYTLLVIPALGAALLGGLNSVALATVGGLALGMLQSSMVNMANRDWWPGFLPGTAVQKVVPLAVVILVLFLLGNRLPVRGSIGTKGQPRAPKPNHVVLGTMFAAGVGLFLTNVFTTNWMVAFTTTLVAIMVMLSLTVLVGYLGQISLAQMSIAGVAAFAMVRFAGNGEKVNDFDAVAVPGLDLPDPVAALLGIATAVVVGVILGLPALRIRGVQLAVVTITAVAAIEEFIFKNEAISGPGARTNNPVSRPSWFGIDIGVQDEADFLTDNWQFTTFAIILLVLIGMGVANLRRGQTGRRFLSVRSNERAAAAAGVDVARTKLLGFAISSAIAGVGGVLFAYKLTIIKFDNFGVFIGLAVLAFVYLGGITTIYGAIIGGLLTAGGLVNSFITLHFEDVNRDYITIVGAIGLIVNAIVTNGEGVALLQTDQGKHVLKGLRRKPKALAEEDPDGDTPPTDATTLVGEST
ncbi:MAG: ABC transporter permease [Acidimicrobiales bacterium]